MFSDRPLEARALGTEPSSIGSSRSTAATPASARPRSASTSARGRRTWASAATSTSSSLVDPAVTVVLDVQRRGWPPDDGLVHLPRPDGTGLSLAQPPAGAGLLLPSPDLSPAAARPFALPPGTFQVEYTRGPEYLTQTRTITVPRTRTHHESFQLQRWIHLAKMNWFSGDHHVHAAGCAHYESPTEGVKPEDMWRHILGEDLDVGCVLSWGPCWYAQKQFFEGKIHPLSTSEYLMRYDVEVSGFPSSHAGHLCLLRLKEDDYPGTTRIEEWPSWDLPVLKWGKSQGGVVGFSHSGWGLKTSTDDDCRPYEVPPFDGIGANEYIVDVVHDAVDFISTVDTPAPWELNIWYHTLNCGYRAQDQRRDRFPLHLRRARRPGASLRQARRRPARFRPLVRGHQARPVLRQRRPQPPDRFPRGRPRRGRGGQRAQARRRRRRSRSRARVAAFLMPSHPPRRRRSTSARSTRSPTGTSSGPGSARRRKVPVEVVVNGISRRQSGDRRRRQHSRTSLSTCRSRNRAGSRCGSTLLAHQPGLRGRGRQADPGFQEIGRMVPEERRSVLVAEGACHSPVREGGGQKSLRPGAAGVSEDSPGIGR